MREFEEEPILTETYRAAADFLPLRGSTYLFGKSQEERSSHLSAWQTRAADVSFFELNEEGPDAFVMQSSGVRYSLRSTKALLSIFSNLDKGVVYVDITGLSHSVWAALIRAALLSDVDLRVVYVEPDQYSRSTAPVDGQIYDLSSRIAGIAPLPGFAVLASPAEFLFVPLLGFEGTRLRHLIEQIQPAAGRIVPVVGSPGFKPWYVFETYAGNRSALVEDSAWQEIRFAPANCPFSCFYLLNDIAQSAGGRALKIAPIGTKPHALGAVLYALNSATPTELVYDHPIRKAGRTDGSSRLLVYHVAALARSGARRHVTRWIRH